ncbi:asparagine synthase (glutamine-hydrolyzing) [Paramagnetospirillum kuznetsovii]|uniref:asparagine synthase (glutamine-hydrolyzing) n=1 Tax=Paramagnetospirillum kuznetsovii TaxID=2053833 RepID=A0A364NXN6_9PROT|nr:asparagine synthase (glutamine-hydrolyzing) [Paramagnetospirillum kuznetsovii]RAU21826.1 asparagine synthase (glutamine-hydrolyzing) [Paramagnetospirillum kuznetsovii]
MCGIVGVLDPDLNPATAPTMLGAMAATILHRGPDDVGMVVLDYIGLAMRRLAILDLAHGHQPMASPDGRYTIVLNGEIYNHAQLRPELAAQGWGFSTTSDTEVLLAAWALMGRDCLPRLNGMFAFAVWDGREGTLTLARDRLGVKPLYYYHRGGRLLFASEIKALLASGLVDRELDPRGLWDYLTFRYVPGPGSIWRDVAKLPPGHLLTVEPGGEPAIERWWDIPYAEPTRIRSSRRLQDEFTLLFSDAVRLRMLADVPVGILLSGGLDSSAVAAAAAESGCGRVDTFSVAFADSPATDELPYARQVAAALGLNHTEVVIGRNEFMDTLPSFVHHTDEPLADLASVPLYHVCRLARGSAKVVLSGEGADEILAGYDFDRVVGDWDRAFPMPTWWRRRLGVRRADPLAADPPPHMTNYLSSADKTAMFRQPVECADSMTRVRTTMNRCGSGEPLNRMLYVYCQDWLVEDLLMKADRMSMAVSLELRTPFLDYRLVEWAAGAPTSVKVGRDEAGDWCTKAVLRQYAATRLPREIVNRPKQGFPVPVYDWLSGPLRDWARDCLAGGGRLSNWLDPTAVAAMVERGTAEEAPMMDRHRLWNLLILDMWVREWMPRC